MEKITEAWKNWKTTLKQKRMACLVALFENNFEK